MLNMYYDVALRNMNERYGYTTEELAFIQNHRYKIEWEPDSRKRPQSNTRFFFSLVDNNGDANPDTLHLSGVGVAVLICLLISSISICSLSNSLLYKNSNHSRQHVRCLCAQWVSIALSYPKTAYTRKKTICR